MWASLVHAGFVLHGFKIATDEKMIVMMMMVMDNVNNNNNK